MARDKHEYENDDVDLTGMINEYGKDNELRRKIDALKKQREEEAHLARNGQRADRGNNQGYTQVGETKSEKGIPDIRVDHTLVDMPRVNEEEDVDKTLVILGHKKGVSYDASVEIEDNDENKTALFDRYQASQYDEMDEEDSPTTTTRGLFERHVEEDEDDFDEDESEEWEEDDEEEEDAIDRDNTTMNKVITYAIVGFVSILVLVIGYFGVSYAMGKFGGTEKKPEVAEPAKPNETQDKEDKKPVVEEDKKPKEDINTNTAKIAQLNKQLDTYKKQLDQVNANLKNARDTVNSTASELALYETIRKQAEGYKTQAYSAEANVTVAQEALKVAEEEYKLADGEEAKAQAKIKVDDAKVKLQAAKNSVKDLYNLSAIKSEEYASKEQAIRAANDKQTSAKEMIRELNDKKVGIEKHIANVTTEIARLKKE